MESGLLQTQAFGVLLQLSLFADLLAPGRRRVNKGRCAAGAGQRRLQERSLRRLPPRPRLWMPRSGRAQRWLLQRG